MAALRWLLVIAMFALAVVSVVDSTGLLAAQGSAKSGVLYRCPMHPSVVQDHPGECPICSMTLVRDENPSDASSGDSSGNAEAGEHGELHSDVPGLAAVELSDERIQLTGMRTQRALRKTVGTTLRAYGLVVAPESAVVSVQSRASGWIQSLPVASTGGAVAKGQVLAYLYGPELLTAQRELLSALHWGDSQPRERAGSSSAAGIGDRRSRHSHDLRSLAKDARARLELLGIDAGDIAALERAGSASTALPIRAPRSGIVTRKGVVAGAAVQPGTELFEIADLSRVWVLAQLQADDAHRLQSGGAAEFRIANDPSRSFRGTIDLLYPAVDASTRTVQARIEVANTDGSLRPGVFGEVEVAIGSHEALIVPSSAIVDTGDLQIVFVALPGGHFVPRRVTVGGRHDDTVEIVAGLSDGDLVVTTGNFLIDSESRLRAAIEGYRASQSATQRASQHAAQPAAPPAMPPAAHGAHGAH